jgi:aspartate/methionine/tyrosine aminotransferase
MSNSKDDEAANTATEGRIKTGQHENELGSTDAFRRSPTLAVADQIEVARKAGQDVISLSTPSFPTHQSVEVAPLASGMRLSAPEGDPMLRAEVRSGLFGRWDLPDHGVCITAGAKVALFSVLRALPVSGAAVLVPGPAWPTYEDIVRLAGHLPHPVWTDFADGFRLDPDILADHLRRTKARAVFLANPGNPTGRIHTQAELHGALEACQTAGAVLVLDESFSEIIFDSTAWAASVVAHDPALVIVNSFSKNHHLQGQRVAACLMHRSRMDSFVAVHQTLISSAPSFGQAAALAALRDGPVANYAEARAISTQIIARAGWPCQPNQGSFYHFPCLTDAQAVLAQLREVGLFALAGSAFGSPYGEHLRLCFGRPTTEMAEILKRIEASGLLR